MQVWFIMIGNTVKGHDRANCNVLFQCFVHAKPMLICADSGSHTTPDLKRLLPHNLLKRTSNYGFT